MIKFNYKAVDKNKKIITGSIIADNINDAESKLIASDYIILELKQETVQVNTNSNIIYSIDKWRLFITEELSELLDANVPLIRALQVLIKETKDKNKKNVIKSIYTNICNGSTFYNALSIFPDIFDEFYVYSIKAGELSGTLDKSFNRLSEYYRFRDSFKKKIINALLYPVFLLIMTFISLIIISTFVIPKLIPVLKEMNTKLPPITLFTLSINAFITNYLFYILILVILIIILISTNKKYLKKQFIFYGKNIFFIKTFIRDIFTTNLFRTLYSLVENGVDLPDALKIIQNTDSFYSAKVKEIIERLKHGSNFSDAVNSSELIDEKAIIILSIAEEGGTLENAFNKLSNIYSQELNKKFDMFTKSIGPIFIIIMAVLIGFIIISIMLPIISMNVTL